MLNIEKERALFEDWHYKHFGRAVHRASILHGGARKGLEYWGDDTNNAWDAWQTARATPAQGDELPPLPEARIRELYQSSYLEALEEAGFGIGNGDVAHMLHPVKFARAIEREYGAACRSEASDFWRKRVAENAAAVAAERGVLSAFDEFDRLRKILKTPGYCDGTKYTEREAFGMAIGAACRAGAKQGDEDARDAALEEAATIAGNFGPQRPIVAANPGPTIVGRWEGEQAASTNIAAAIRKLKSGGAARASQPGDSNA